MKRSRLKLVPKAPADDLSFLPPFNEQAKYLKLADDFLARTGAEEQRTKSNVRSIDTAGASMIGNPPEERPSQPIAQRFIR